MRELNPPIIRARGGSPTALAPTNGLNGYAGVHGDEYANGNGSGGFGNSNGNGNGNGTEEDREALFAFIDTVFNNILDLRETNRRLLEILYVRQREQVRPVFSSLTNAYLLLVSNNTTHRRHIPRSCHRTLPHRIPYVYRWVA